MQATLAELNWPPHTARLRLRPATADDAGATWAYRRLEPVSRWLTSAAADRQEYERAFAEPARLSATVIVERPDPTGPAVIGDLKIAVEDAWGQHEVADRVRGVQAEIGWVLDPAHHGHGYATEAVTESLRICFTALGLRRVVAYCFAANEPSWRLMERVGMRREMHTVADSLHRSGTWLDGLGYAMLAQEWSSMGAGASR